MNTKRAKNYTNIQKRIFSMIFLLKNSKNHVKVFYLKMSVLRYIFVVKKSYTLNQPFGGRRNIKRFVKDV